MQPGKLRFDILEEMANVTRKTRTLFDARVREKGLTLARARTLLRVHDSETTNQRELADELEIESATLVRLIDGLEMQGLIERREVEGDRRAKHVVLTAEGIELAGIVERMAKQVAVDVLAGIPQQELERALTVSRRMAANLDATGSALSGR